MCEDNEIYFRKASVSLKEYRKTNRKEIVKSMFKMRLSDMSAMIFDFIKRKF